MHGWGGDSSSLKLVANDFKDEFRVTLVDFYGTKGTPHPDYPLILEDFSSAIIDLINYYHMTNVILVGHSFGGRVGVKLVAKYGYIFDALILIAGAGLKPRRKLSYYIKVLNYKIKKAWGFKNLPKGSKDYNALSPTMKKTFINIVNEHLDIHLPYITLPTLLIWGKKDKETPLFMAKKFFRHIKDSKLFLLDGGHFIYAEKTAECVAIIKNFLGELYG